MPFNLSTRFSDAFDRFKKKYAKIITQVHIKLTQITSEKDILTEEQIHEFETRDYKVDFKLLK